jgi:hypothetical protein
LWEIAVQSKKSDKIQNTKYKKGDSLNYLACF